MPVYPDNKRFNQGPHYLPSLFVTSSSLNLWHISQFDLFKDKLPTSPSLSTAVVRANPPPAFPPYVPAPSLHCRVLGCHSSALAVTAPPSSLLYHSAPFTGDAGVLGHLSAAPVEVFMPSFTMRLPTGCPASLSWVGSTKLCCSNHKE